MPSKQQFNSSSNIKSAKQQWIDSHNKKYTIIHILEIIWTLVYNIIHLLHLCNR